MSRAVGELEEGVSRMVSWTHRDDFVQAPLFIHNPHALPLFREERRNKRHLDGRTKDAHERTKPDPGITALRGQTGTGGEIGATGGTLLTQHVLKHHVRAHHILTCSEA